MNSVSDVWQVVLERLRAGGLVETAISTWFDEVEAVAVRDLTFYLCCPNDFKRGTIESLFIPNLKAALKDIFSADFDVRLLSAAERDAFGQEKPKKPASLLESGEFTFDTFVVGDSNKLAYAAARAVADAPAEHYNPLFIYGDSGLGKTHLLSAIQHEMQKNYPGINIIYIPSETFTNEFLHSISANTTEEFDNKYRSADALLIDDIQFIAGKDQTEEKFFHIFNELYNQNKVIVLTSDRPAREIRSISDRLRTRFSSGLIADVKPPEFETRLLIIQRKAELLDFHIPEDVVTYISTKLKSNIRQIEGVVTKLNALYMVNQVKPTIPVAQKIINDIMTDHQPTDVTIDKIIGEVGKIYNVAPDEMRSQKRAAVISQARKVAIYVIQNVLGLPYETIGQEFNGRDHSTVVYAINDVKKKMEQDSSFKSVVEDLIKNIRANL